MQNNILEQAKTTQRRLLFFYIKTAVIETRQRIIDSFGKNKKEFEIIDSFLKDTVDTIIYEELIWIGLECLIEYENDCNTQIEYSELKAELYKNEEYLWNMFNSDYYLEVSEYKKNKIVTYFLNNTYKASENKLFFYVLLLFYVSAEEIEKNGTVTLAEEICEKIMGKDVEGCFFDYFNDYLKGEGNINKLMAYYGVPEELYQREKGFSDREITYLLAYYCKRIVDAGDTKGMIKDGYYYAQFDLMRLFLRDVCNNSFFGFLKQEQDNKLFDINCYNYNALYNYPINFNHVALSKLKNVLITVEENEGRNDGKKQRTTKLKDVRMIVYEEFCESFGYVYEGKYKESYIIKIFEKYQRRIYGDVLIDLRSGKFKFSRSSVAYNCNMIMIMRICMCRDIYTFSGELLMWRSVYNMAYDRQQNDANEWFISEFKHKELVASFFEEFPDVLNEYYEYDGKNIVLLLEDGIEKKISVDLVYKEYWKLERSRLTTSYHRKTLGDIYKEYKKNLYDN